MTDVEKCDRGQHDYFHVTSFYGFHKYCCKKCGDEVTH